MRDALYMPTLVAMLYNPGFKAKYRAMIKAGKPPKVAITPLMRKYVELPSNLLHQRGASIYADQIVCNKFDTLAYALDVLIYYYI